MCSYPIGLVLAIYELNVIFLCIRYVLNLIHLEFFSLVGSKHQSHQDYLEKADKARSERLSSGSPPAK